MIYFESPCISYTYVLVETNNVITYEFKLLIDLGITLLLFQLEILNWEIRQ